MAYITLNLVGPLVAKKNRMRASVTKSGRMFQFKDPRVRAAEEALGYEIAAQVWKLPDRSDLPLKGPVSVTAFFDRGRADVVGALETLLDAMQGTVYVNDRQAEHIEARHVDGQKGIKVTIATL